MVALYDALVFAIFVLIVFIYLVGYWFSQISYHKEGFCIDTKCDIKIVNMQFKQLYSWLAFLLKRIDIIQKIVPTEMDGTVEDYTEMYLTFEEFMVKIKDVYDKQNYIIKALQRFKPNESSNIPKFRKLTDQCFQLRTNEECGTEPVKKELVRINGKLEEITFRTKSVYKTILQWEAFEKEYAEIRKKTVADVNVNINNVIKELGLPLPKFDIGDPLPEDEAQKLKDGDLSSMKANAKNNRELQQVAANVDSKAVMANADKNNPDNGPAIKGQTGGMVGKALSSDKPEAGKAAKKMDGAQDETNIPSNFRT
jgi:hypothetical protein